jgi:TolA-binding protein
MKLFIRTLTAASVALAITMPGAASATPLFVHDTVTPRMAQQQLMRDRLQSLRAQMRNLESEVLRMQETLRRSEIAQGASAPDMLDAYPSQSRQANACPSQGPGQSGGSCGTAGMMQGMMQMMGQMMQAFVQ